MSKLWEIDWIFKRFSYVLVFPLHLLVICCMSQANQSWVLAKRSKFALTFSLAAFMHLCTLGLFLYTCCSSCIKLSQLLYLNCYEYLPCVAVLLQHCIVPFWKIPLRISDMLVFNFIKKKEHCNGHYNAFTKKIQTFKTLLSPVYGIFF